MKPLQRYFRTPAEVRTLFKKIQKQIGRRVFPVNQKINSLSPDPDDALHHPVRDVDIWL